MKGPSLETHRRSGLHVTPTSCGYCRQRLQHCDPCNGDGNRNTRARVAGERATSRQSLRLIAVMIVTVSVLMVAHLTEVLVWSFAYMIVRVAPPGTDLICKLHNARLRRRDSVGALAIAWANDGDERRIVVFGWSTAVIFQVLRKTMMTLRSGEGQREPE